MVSVDRLVIDYANLLDGNVKKKKNIVYFVQFLCTKEFYMMNVIAVCENVTILSQNISPNWEMLQFSLLNRIDSQVCMCNKIATCTLTALV